jgi:HlyD family secretion protein
MKTDAETQPDILQIIGDKPSSKGTKVFKRAALVAGLVLLVLIVIVIYKKGQNDHDMQYKTQPVERGNLIVTVTATGTLEPTNQVQVGSELSGIVKTVEVDYNDRVQLNQILARLDTSKLEAQVKQSAAALESAQAKVLEAQATVMETQNELDRLRHVRELSGDKVPSKQEMDSAEAALERARASEAAEKSQVSLARANLEVDKTDLGKMIIRSPINGIVLSRTVEPGQTVAASFQTPVLFTLAEDLSKMELHVAVDEADVGKVEINQTATFTVDAYPDRTFPATIIQVRYGAATVDGVVTYETLLQVDNSDLLLRPGMTATAEITVKRIENAILVPNAGLRFKPPSIEIPSPAGSRSFLSRLLPRPPQSAPRAQEEAPGKDGRRRVWTLREGRLEAIFITTGATDGNVTEVKAGVLEPGMTIVTDMTGAAR